MEEYFARFGGVRDYLRDVVAQARVTGYTETMLGRRRYLPDLTADNRQRREMAERMALNAPIQGSAADIIKLAMLRVDAALTEAGARSRTLLQVHDELVLEIAPGERESVEALVRKEMGAAIETGRPARGQHRRRLLLAGRRPLTRAPRAPAGPTHRAAHPPATHLPPTRLCAGGSANRLPGVPGRRRRSTQWGSGGALSQGLRVRA